MRTKKQRLETLETINAIFRKYKLPEWDHERRIGKVKQKEYEILDVVKIIDDLEAHHITIIFRVIDPTSLAIKDYGVRYNTGPTSLVIAIVNGKVLFSKQHRLPFGLWMCEMPRGWIPREENVSPLMAARSILQRKVGAEWYERLVIHEVECIGKMMEDSSTRGDELPVYYVIANHPYEQPKPHDIFRPTLYSWNEVDVLKLDGAIRDQKTLAAISMLETHLRRKELDIENIRRRLMMRDQAFNNAHRLN